MHARRRVAVLFRVLGSVADDATPSRLAPFVSPAAAQRLAADVAAQVAGLRTTLNDTFGAVDTIGALDVVEEGRTRLAEFDGSMRRLLVDASVEREAESILAAAAGNFDADVPTSRAQRRRDLDDAIAIVHPAADPTRRRAGAFNERAAALVAGAAALIVAVGLGSVATSPPDVQGDLLRSAVDTTVATDTRGATTSTSGRTTGSDTGQAAGRPSRTSHEPSPNVDPYTLEIRWLFDPARGLLARLRDVTTVRSLVMREFEGIVAGLATERPSSVEDLVTKAEAVARAEDAEAKASDSAESEASDTAPGANSGEPGPSRPGSSQEPAPQDGEGTDGEGTDGPGTDGEATDDDAPTATDQAPEPPPADGDDGEAGTDGGAAQDDDTGILGPPGGW